MSGKYVVIEGVDGVGKTTLAKMLLDQLSAIGSQPPIMVTEPQREPGTVGYEIRRRLKHGPRLEAWEAVGMFVADRIQQRDNVLRPRLKDGVFVIQDRSWLSTVIYQGERAHYDCGNQISPVDLIDFHIKLMPAIDLLILLDTDPAIAAKRSAVRGGGHDQFDYDGLDILTRRRVTYMNLTNRCQTTGGCRRLLVIDAGMPQADVFGAAWLSVDELLREKECLGPIS